MQLKIDLMDAKWLTAKPGEEILSEILMYEHEKKIIVEELYVTEHVCDDGDSLGTFSNRCAYKRYPQTKKGIQKIIDFYDLSEVVNKFGMATAFGLDLRDEEEDE